ncbi:DUF4834 family protein [Hufsiella ginkgonis]|uniref:DUF4834 domain-containing protein n=1 Tax=Hufsiella ginkgonis TaxID=2695274 RepID=A0A7K1XTV3_9SPHI|nr:DUF4834 family protein [Hufsiella ginkgonis]MXV14435.1 DUF4834 domain-containing protein [Hufsiella ginkgonis]
MGLIRFLLIAITVLYVIRLLVRLLLPMLFQRVINKAQQQAGQQYRQQHTRSQEGSIRVDFIPPKDKEAKAADKAGEFIDYEELK